MTLLVSLLLSLGIEMQGQGSIAGRIVRPDGQAVAGVMVIVQETGALQISGADGRYAFTRLKPGNYTLVHTLAGYSATQQATVTGDGPTAVETTVDWPLSFVETLVVTTASRQVESIADAPALVSLIDEATVLRQSGSNQLPMLLAASPGVHVAQSGLYDINLNTRGFNDFVSRSVRTEIDGRDASMPQVMGYTDWASMPFDLGEVERIELLNGPGGALYGVGALNGVLSVRTKPADASLGGRARFTVGELGTTRVDARHALALGGGWFVKAIGGYQRSGDFAESRSTAPEYGAGRLALEAVPLSGDKPELAYGSARIDRRLASGALITAEGGTAWKRGQVSLTSLGRYQATGSTFPWARGAFESSTWTLHGALTTATVNNQVGLASGQATFQQASNIELDGRTNRTFARGAGHWVGGASYARQRVDSANEQGVQTNYEHPETADSGSLYAQVDYTIAERWRASAAGRLDMSSLSGTTLSPRAAVVYDIGPGQRARVAFSRAFKAPTIAGLRLRAPIAPSINLSGLEAALAPLLGGTSLGFSSVPLLAVGNEALKAEDVSSIEAGYNTVISDRAFLQVTYYWSHRNRFTSGLLPQLGTSLGRLNPSFGPYRAPSTLSAQAAGAVYAALDAALPPTLRPMLSNAESGAPIFAMATFANFAAASAHGVDVSGTIRIDDQWRIDLAYSWFDATVKDQPPDVPLLPNTPPHQGSVGMQYVAPRLDVSMRARFVHGFDWVSGVYTGPVPGSAVVDLQANTPLSDRLTVGIDVANLLDRRHYEMFGGDLLARRALAHLTVGW